MKTSTEFPPDFPGDERQPTAGFDVIKFKINLATPGSDPSIERHCLPTIGLSGSKECKLTATVFFVPDGRTIPPPVYDKGQGKIALYFRLEAYAAVLDALTRPGRVECGYFETEKASFPWARLSRGDIVRQLE